MNEITKNIFTKIYQQHKWSGNDTVSGPGSTLKATENIRRAIPELIKQYNIKSIVDIGCGDLNWIKELNIAVAYIGVDSVKDLIERNRQKYANMRFIWEDITQVIPPTSDLVITRDVLIHLNLEDISNMIKNVTTSQSTYWLLSTYTDCTKNIDTSMTRWRPLNMCVEPFSFPAPIHIINEGCAEKGDFSDKSLALWKINAI